MVFSQSRELLRSVVPLGDRWHLGTKVLRGMAWSGPVGLGPAWRGRVR